VRDQLFSLGAVSNGAEKSFVDSELAAFAEVRVSGGRLTGFDIMRPVPARHKSRANSCVVQFSRRSFLPQFVDATRGHAALQICALGILFAVMGWCSDSMYALLAGTLAERIRGSARLRSTQRNLSGGMLIALGLASAFAGAKSK
jgi:hypothetical protein